MENHVVYGRGMRVLAAFAWVLAGASALEAAACDLSELSLGGTKSYASFINNDGDVVGYSYLAGGSSYHAFLYSGMLETDLGTLGSSVVNESVPTGLSDTGSMVTGYSWNSSNAPNAFLYNGTLQDVGAISGGTNSFGEGVNSSGVVVGYSSTTGSSTNQAFLSTGDTDLGTLGGSQSAAVGINDSGQIAGNSNLSGDAHSQAFFSQNGSSLVAIPTLGGNNSTAVAINASGDVTGQSYLSNNTNYSAFLYTPGGGTTDLDTLSGGTEDSLAVAINTADQVTGNIYVSGGYENAFIYSNGVMTDLGTLGGTTSTAMAINNLGWVVGTSTTASGATDPFVWMNGVMTDLDTLMPDGSDFISLTTAVGINDSGTIIGVGKTTNGQTQAYELTAPAEASDSPEPGSLLPVGLGLLAGIAGLARRRAR